MAATSRALGAAVLVAAACAGCGASSDGTDAQSAPPTSLTAATATVPTTAPTTTVAPVETTTTTEAPPETAPEPAPETTTAPAPPPPRATVPYIPPPPAPPPAPRAPAPSFADQVWSFLPGGIADRLSGWTVQWQPSRSGYLAVTWPATHTIDVYVRPGRSAALTAYDLAHEYGHALDVSYLNAGTRGQWGQRRGIDTSSWFGCDMCNDFAAPSGDWAESVAVCLTGNRGTFRSKLAGLPSGADCDWIFATVGPW
jgi:hypothetical protein